MWKKLSSKIILDHPRLKVVEDDVELPSGHKTQYLRFETSGNATTIIAIDGEGKLLLQKEYSYPTDENLYQFPGGFVPDGENLEVGANRELVEEAHVKATRLTLLGSYLTNNRRSVSKTYVYLAQELKEAHADGDLEEEIDSYWFTEKEIDTFIAGGELKNGHSLAAWSLYKVRRGNKLDTPLNSIGVNKR